MFINLQIQKFASLFFYKFFFNKTFEIHCINDLLYWTDRIENLQHILRALIYNNKD